jgi:hypothetical protein
MYSKYEGRIYQLSWFLLEKNETRAAIEKSFTKSNPLMSGLPFCPHVFVSLGGALTSTRKFQLAKANQIPHDIRVVRFSLVLYLYQTTKKYTN